jgi:hypothetical protein
MEAITTTVTYSNKRYGCFELDLTGYYVNAERGSYIYNEGGSPDLPASFDVHSIKINDVEMIDNLTESFIDELVELALINLK